MPGKKKGPGMSFGLHRSDKELPERRSGTFHHRKIALLFYNIIVTSFINFTLVSTFFLQG
jgi:hypothetical protein